jgi:hypothetical protein
MTFEELWDDQKEFNQELYAHSEDYRHLRSDEVAFVKEMVLNLASESDELLRTMQWKRHRKIALRPNREHTLEELVDQFKIWMTLAQRLGFTVDDVRRGYLRKSMVVRQRMSEEWVKTLAGPLAVVDIDQVLCDYLTGITAWVRREYPQYGDRIRQLWHQRTFISAETMQLPFEEWEQVKHHFRTSGAKARLPVMPGARPFLTWCRTTGLTVVLLTSRPIDRYPNIYTDTLDWLRQFDLPFDFIWWSSNKSDRILEGDIRSRVSFVVDDDPRFIRQMERLQIPLFWLTPERRGEHLEEVQRQHWPDGRVGSTVHVIHDLEQISKHYTQSSV